MSFGPWGASSGLTDFFNPAAQEWWGEQHNMILGQGVEGFWLDMNEPARMRPDWVGWNEEGKAWGAILRNFTMSMPSSTTKPCTIR